MTTPLYARRSKIVSQIENFWPLVLEQAPPEIDQFIQPSDSALILSTLTALSVSHFEVGEPDGDPRSVAIRWEFSANEYFEDEVLEKKFWYRRGKDGWTGLVSEPVKINWKKDKDLTGGLLDLVCKAWEVEKNASSLEKDAALSPVYEALRKKIESTGMGGLSFFAWFGFIGRKITAKESAEATKIEQERRDARTSGKPLQNSLDGEDGEDGEDEDEDDLDMDLEIFPEGDDLAVAITEDLWPGAIKYFSKAPMVISYIHAKCVIAQAQEQDALSDADFESDDEELDDVVEQESDRPAKKQRSS